MILLFLSPLSFPFLLQGANASALEKEIGPEQFPVNEHYFGLVNVSASEKGPLRANVVHAKPQMAPVLSPIPTVRLKAC